MGERLLLIAGCVTMRHGKGVEMRVLGIPRGCSRHEMRVIKYGIGCGCDGVGIAPDLPVAVIKPYGYTLPLHGVKHLYR